MSQNSRISVYIHRLMLILAQDDVPKLTSHILWGEYSILYNGTTPLREALASPRSILCRDLSLVLLVTQRFLFNSSSLNPLSYLDHYPLLSKSLACMFLVILGSFTTSPSSSFVILTWHPKRLVSVRPNAKSSMSFSSSSGSGIKP